MHFDRPTNDQRIIVAKAVSAAYDLYKSGYGYKKAGVVATRIEQECDLVPSLFEDKEALEREHRITSALDVINGTFGRGTVKLAAQGSGRIKASNDNQSPHYTTRWEDIPKVVVK